MNIDGDAATVVRQFNSREDIYHLRYDVTNMAYHLARRGKALVIGVGGGRDIQSAVLFGQEHVVGVEINPIFVDLLRKDFRIFAGLTDRPDVTLVTAEARGYLSQRREKVLHYSNVTH
jgi:spermidine synthase